MGKNRKSERRPQTPQAARGMMGNRLLLTGFLHWAQKLWWQEGHVTLSWSPSLIKPEMH